MRYLFLLALVIVTGMVKAQITVSAQLPPAGFVQKEQLWNLILVNNKNEVLDVRMRMNVQDAISGQVVLSANTMNFLIGKGVKNITNRDLQPIAYNFSLPDMMRSYLPMGAYNICYQVIGATKDVPLAEECVRVNIDPLSPPLLANPADKSVIATPYPQFSWIPPAPFEMFNNLSYDLLITEILPGQAAAEAVNNNIPVYFKTNILQPYEAYASSFNKLDTGKTYAWQVVAKNGTNYSGKTDIWTFRLQSDSIQKLIALYPYTKISDASSEISIAPEGILKMEINNSSNDLLGYFTVRNLSSQNKQKASFKMEIPLSPGPNFITYNTAKHGKLKYDNVYEVEYRNAAGVKKYMRFTPFYYSK